MYLPHLPVTQRYQGDMKVCMSELSREVGNQITYKVNFAGSLIDQL